MEKGENIIMKKKLICLSGILIIILLFGSKAVKEVNMKSDIDNKYVNNEEEIFYIEYNNDIESIDNVDDIVDKSDLVVEGTIVKKGITKYISFVNKELEEKFIQEGYPSEYYSDIWTFYEIHVDKILSGACIDNKIKYRCLGGQIGNVILEQKIAVEEGKKYLLCLQKDDDGVYMNSLNDNAVMLIEEDKIISENISDNLVQQFDELSDFEEAIQDE